MQATPTTRRRPLHVACVCIASLQASKNRGWRPLSPQQPIFDAFEWADNDHLINFRWNFKGISWFLCGGIRLESHKAGLDFIKESARILRARGGRGHH